MELKDCFHIWDKLTPEQQAKLSAASSLRTAEKGTIIHSGSNVCTGLILVTSGQLRAYMLSPEGREVTLYRLFDMDMCLFSAACVMNSLQLDIIIEAEKDTEFYLISPMAYKALMEQSLAVSNYTNEIMGTCVTEVMWLMEQIMWKSLDKRVAAFLLEESAIEGTNSLKMTHETIANHLGTHREVVTRMLRYFQQEGLVRLSRGTVEIADEKALRGLCGE